MQHLSRRRSERSNTLSLVEYVILGGDGVYLSRGMGRTRNVSEGGLLLETHRPLTEGQTVLITLGLKDDTLEVRGRVTHQESPSPFSAGARYCAGIRFTAMNKKGIGVLKRYILAAKDQFLPA